MLERASACLESGGRQLLRRTRRCSKSRRMLHSTFWYHAAGDLGLPIWCAPAAQFETTTISHESLRERANEHRHGGVNTGQSSIALEFLYPAKTLAFIQHLSNIGWDNSNDRRKLHYPASGIRHFSSRSGNVQEFTSLEADPSLAEENEEVEGLLKNTNALQALQALLQSSNDHRRERVVWRLYEFVGEADRTPSLRADLLDYLASSKKSVDAYRLIQVFESLANQDRRASSYCAAITAYLRLNMVGTAVKIHGEAAGRATELSFGSDILLARTIQDNQWDLAFQVREAFASSYHCLNDKTENFEQQSSFLWSGVLAIPELLERAASLLQYAQQFAHNLAPASDRGKSFKIFARAFFPSVIKQALKSKDPDEKSLLDLFDRLQELKLSRKEYYELAISTMLRHSKYMQYTNEGKPHLRLYLMFRTAYLEKTQGVFLPPSEPLIRALMNHLSRFQSYNDRRRWMITVNSLVTDLRQFHSTPGPNNDRRLNPNNLRFIMGMYARAGDAEKVHRIFDELCKSYDESTTSTRHRKQHITSGAIWPLLYVHARRVELHAVVEQFQRISNEFGLQPDTRAWNILLHAYARAEDLDGLVKTFEDFLESGNAPGVDSFGPVLDICARRGDVDSIEALFSKARLLGIPIDRSAILRGALVLAHINSENLPAAEEAMELMVQDKRDGKLDGQLTTTANFLITAYALRQDSTSTMKAYGRYKPHDIPLDSYTYAALMQSLISMRQTNAAFTILTTTMPNNNVQGHAFHYALAIAGFLNEGQLNRAKDAQKRMLLRNVPHSVSSRMAFLQVKVLSELDALKKERPAMAKYRLPRLKEVEEELRQALMESDPSERALKQPRQGMRQTPLNQMVLDGYFETMVLIYGTHGAYDLCKEMFESAAMYRQSNPDAFEAPIGLLTAVMTGHQRAHEHAEVDKCWELARLQAAKLTKLTSKFQDAPMPGAPPLRVARNRSHLLVPTTRVYFRGLASRKAHITIGKMRNVVSSLLDEGYTIDNLTWNEYIQYLARSGYFLDAFTACESYLMPDFVGWRFAAPHYLRVDPHGYLRMDLRRKDTRKHTVMPRYKTLVIMAAALGYIRRQEEMGIEPEPVQKCSLRRLQEVAPKTIRAIETMPVLPDEKLQRRYLMGPRTL
ncbi:uncharacterized protein BDZ99DRAFT_12122 [Mytilinidion resinicola]|uniref:TPR-like protein n=1 Tax=Mytilinidion resinicola TaxID=574789 RepID=A0A6A6Z8C8_9PEZI|nr:uncharacterized protein BDZ99DRAFT_12122 [Mytilinidion resinicola]KAF2817270.1 hypothetical protein BDZ99DRAFT_12122 [Mytilinidion resinicola]